MSVSLKVSESKCFVVNYEINLCFVVNYDINVCFVVNFSTSSFGM
jgi:hypothetical protein